MTWRILAAVLCALAVLPGPVLADVETGKRLYGEKGCGGCHMIDGVGGQAGPDLSREGARRDRDRDWHIRHFLNPAEVVPGSFMPVLVSGPEEAGHLADYVLSLGAETEAAETVEPLVPGATAAQPNVYPDVVYTDEPPIPAATAGPETTPEAPPAAGAAEAPQLAAGDAERGQRLFAAKGCPACHAVRGTGGTLGPDLTFEGEVKGHGADWHLRHFADPAGVVPGSTMPPFDLSPQEGADLAAYVMSLVRVAADRTLGSELAYQFAALGARLESLQTRIDRARANGRNVDDLTVSLSEAWTHVGAVEEMVRNREMSGAAAEIEAAHGLSQALEEAVTAFERKLRIRAELTYIVLIMLVIGIVLLLQKIRMLSREWDAAHPERLQPVTGPMVPPEKVPEKVPKKTKRTTGTSRSGKPEKTPDQQQKGDGP